MKLDELPLAELESILRDTERVAAPDSPSVAILRRTVDAVRQRDTGANAPTQHYERQVDSGEGGHAQ
jgi:hypothetical protein